MLSQHALEAELEGEDRVVMSVIHSRFGSVTAP
jgi:hypothetical protein